MKQKRGRLAIIGIALVWVLAACGTFGVTDTASDWATAAGFPVTVENCGRTLRFDRPPTRVVTSFQPTLETLVTLGVADNVIGRSRSLDHLGAAGYLPGQQATVEAITEVSDTDRPPVKERLLALNPDLVFGMSYGDFVSARGFATEQELNDAGIPVFIPSNWCEPQIVERYDVTSTFADIRTLGKIFGVSDKAEMVASDLERRLADVQQRVRGLAPPRVMVPDATKEVFYAMGKGMGVNIVSLAGGVNVFADGGEYDEVSVEEVAARNAQAYLVIDYAPLTPKDRIEVIEAVAPTSEGVTQKRYAVVPSVGVHPGVRVVSAIETLAKVLHPNAFA